MSFGARCLNGGKNIGSVLLAYYNMLPLYAYVTEKYSPFVSKTESEKLIEDGFSLNGFEEIQEYVDEQSSKLGLHKIEVWGHKWDPFIGCANFANKSIIRVNRNFNKDCQTFSDFYPKELQQVIINHELGHIFHKHQLQKTVVKAVIGALCISKRTRLIGVISSFAFMSLSSAWCRIQEREADAFSIKQCSSKSALSARIQYFKDLQYFEKDIKIYMEKDWLGRFLQSDIGYLLMNSHPTLEERIATHEKALDALKKSEKTS